MAIFKKIETDELYLFMNGKLIYKRWLKLGYSKVFDVMAYDKHTLTSIRDLEYENPGGLFSIPASITLFPTEEGGRNIGIISGFRPDHVFEYRQNGELLQTFIGDIVFKDNEMIQPGETREVTVRFLLSQPIEKYLSKGRTWYLHEGGRLVGKAIVL